MTNKRVSAEEKSLQRQKRFNSDLGLATAAMGAGALLSRGAGFAAGRVQLKSLNAARSVKGLKPLTRNDPAIATNPKFKTSNRLNTASTVVGSAGAATGATTGVSASLAQKKELDINQGKEREYKKQLAQMSPKKKILKKNLNDSRKKYFYQNNLEQRRNMRNKAYPGAAAAGSAVAAGAAGGLAIGNYKKGKHIKQEKAFASTRDAHYVSADNNKKIADSYRAQEPVHEKVMNTAGKRLDRLQRNAKFNTKRSNVGNAKRQAEANSVKDNAKIQYDRAVENREFADSASATDKSRAVESEQKRLKTGKILGQKRYTKLPGKKATLAVAGVSAGLAGVSAVAHRNNKKNVTRPRHDWWQG